MKFGAIFLIVPCLLISAHTMGVADTLRIRSQVLKADSTSMQPSIGRGSHMQAIYVSPECVARYTELKLGRSLRFIFYKVVISAKATNFVVETIGNRDLTYQDMLDKLPPNSPRIVVFDYETTTDQGKALRKTLYILWRPDASPAMQMAIIYSNQDRLKNLLYGINAQFDAHDKDGLAQSAIEAALKASK